MSERRKETRKRLFFRPRRSLNRRDERARFICAARYKPEQINRRKYAQRGQNTRNGYRDTGIFRIGCGIIRRRRKLSVCRKRCDISQIRANYKSETQRITVIRPHIEEQHTFVDNAGNNQIKKGDKHKSCSATFTFGLYKVDHDKTQQESIAENIRKLFVKVYACPSFFIRFFTENRKYARKQPCVSCRRKRRL